MVEHEGPAALGRGAPGESDDVVSQRRLRLILASVADVVFEIAPDNTCRWVSPSVCEVLGWKPEELVGSVPADLVHPEDLPALLHSREHPVHGVARAMFRFRVADGRYRWMSWVSREVRDGGRLTGRFVGLHDVDAEMRATQALAESERRYRMLAENTNDLVVEVDTEGRVTWVSDSVSHRLGWAPGDLAGTALADLVHPDDVTVLESTQQGTPDGRSGRVRIRLRDAGGGHRLYERAVSRVLGDAGQVVGQVSGWRDVQDEQEALDALHVREREYRLIAENIADVVIRTGPDLIVRWASPALHEMSGWSPEDVVGRSAWEFVHPDDLEALQSAPPDIWDDRPGSASVQGRFRHSDGTYQRWSVIARRAIDESGQASGFIVTLRNVDLEVRARDEAAEEAGHRVAVVQSMLDPHVLLDAVRDGAGTIVDFVYADANDAACEYNRMPRAQLVGASLMEMLPGHAGSGLFDQYCRTVNTGQPLVLDDFVYPHEILAEPRHFDIRGVKVGDALSFTWRDVTDRAEAEARIATSEARYRALVERMTHVTVVTDSQGIVRYVSEAVTDLLGYDVDGFVGLSILDLVHPDDRAQVAGQRDGLIATGTHQDRIRLRCSDGSYRWVESTDRAQLAEDGELAAIIGVWRDAAVAHAGEVIAEHVGDPVFRLADCSVTWVSPSVPRQLGGTQDQWIGLTLRERIHPDDVPVLREAVKPLAQGRPAVGRVRMLGLDQIYRWVDGTGSPTDEPGVVVLSVHVVDDDVSREEALQRLAGSDGLTGLSNRRGLMMRLDALLSKRRTGRQTGLLFCDLDNLKQINDTAGHAAGDAVISAVAQRIRSAVRSDDICARFGGDEFVVVLLGLHGLHQAVAIAEKIRQAATAPVRISDGSSVTPSLSIGVTLAHEEEGSSALLDRADAAMYDAKESGRNAVAAIE